MSGIKIELGRTDGMKRVQELYEKIGPAPQRLALMRRLGVRGEQELKRWFEHLDSSKPNKMGWPRQHFWARIAKSTAYDPSQTTENAATIVVTQPGLGLKVYGGTVEAGKTVSPVTGKLTRNIALPMRPEVYGKMPRGNPIPGLFFIRKKGQGSVGGFLVTATGKGPDRQLTFYYRLVPKITVPKDPDALPPEAKFGAALAETAAEFLGELGGSN